MSEHHQHGPSTMPMLAQCPCYEGGESSEAAAQGTKLHERVAAKLGGDPFAASMIFKLTDEEVAAIDFCADFVRENIAGPWHLEAKIEHQNDDFETVYFGTADLHTESGPLIISDFKFGQERDYYAQACGYALPLMEQRGVTNCLFYFIYGKLQIVRALWIGIEEARETVNRILEAATNPVKQPTPCDYCSWCAKRLTCPALANTVETIASHYDEAVEIKSWHPSEVTHPDTIAYFLGLARIAETWADSVKHRATEMFNQGVPIPGYAQQARRNVSVKDINAAFQRSGLSADDFMACCGVTIGKLTDKYADANILSKDKARKQLEECLGDAISISQSFSLVKERTKKEPINAHIEAK